ncbi:hypothetical protein [Aldersonia kunmingensis]|uniref:hypothetical protein n=1 Tax=Aldersonia kunmingensis TaxID=408066 RepID=UPI000830F2F2|nr:hypothetical protein [Aldersonia kunmingensis]
MSAAPAPNRLRGVFVGAGAGALTVAAHGLGGGAYPDSAALAIVLVLAAAVGGCAASLRAIGPAAALALLGIGQLAGHVTLGALTAHQHAPSALGPLLMVSAHCIATVLCGALILAVERLQAFVDAVARLATIRFTPAGCSWHTETFMAASPVGGTSPSPISRRGPPLVAA